MTYPVPIHLGQFKPVAAGDVTDEYIDIAADLVAGEVIASVVYTVVDTLGDEVVGAVSAHSETDARSDFRYSLGTAGGYLLQAVFTIDDGQVITRTAGVWVV